MIAYAMAKTSYSGEMVRRNRKVVLTIPGAAIKDAVIPASFDLLAAPVIQKKKSPYASYAAANSV